MLDTKGTPHFAQDLIHNFRLYLQISRYKLLKCIGEGGFGTVWMAAQEEPVRRRVALKILKPGMDTKQVVARFEAERQALAMMDHPNIAKVLDGGATAEGRPYFVMELVKGVPITDFCDGEKLSTVDRLRLFRKVCSAVQHAHQKGIIHRDIKPSNVLVGLQDVKAVPQVIDFGIAKALDQRLTEQTIFTEHRQILGTPEYMAPEQAEPTGLDIDTRADIYSLGVLLYELLTGAKPLNLKALLRSGFDEVLRHIREVDPPRPSTRVSASIHESTQAAIHRRTEPSKLSRLLRGDLDWIVMKALDKGRTRRYETAVAFAEDIRRYLEKEPVEARPPSARYRASKFVRRYRSQVIAASLLILSLAAGLVGTGLSLRKANQETVKATNETERATRALTTAKLARQQAEEDRNEKVAALSRAEGLRLLTESASSLESSPSLALLLAMEAHNRAETSLPPHAINDAVLLACSRLRERYTVSPSAIAVSIHPASFGALSRHLLPMILNSRFASSRSGASKTLRMSWATSRRCETLGT